MTKTLKKKKNGELDLLMGFVSDWDNLVQQHTVMYNRDKKERSKSYYMYSY